MTLSTKLIEMLVCPLCKRQVVQAETGAFLECHSCQLIFPVRNGIPVMLVEEAEEKCQQTERAVPSGNAPVTIADATPENT